MVIARDRYRSSIVRLHPQFSPFTDDRGVSENFFGDRYEAYGAGIEPTAVNPYVIKVMEEVGIDLSRSRTESLKEFHGKHFDYVVTICDYDKEVCPFFPAEIILRQSFDDPMNLLVLKKRLWTG